MSTPPPSGNDQAMLAALRQLTVQLQAMLHQQQTLNSQSQSVSQLLQRARQRVSPSLINGQPSTPTPPPAPTQGWMQQAATSLVNNVVRQPQRPGPLPPMQNSPQPNAPYGGAWPQGPSPYNGPVPGPFPSPLVAPSHAGGGGGGASTGAGSWVRSSLPMLGARVAGPWGAVAGVALGALSQVPGEIRSQRDKNAFYQSVEGGSNFAGFGERFSEEVYRWSTLMTLSSDEARQAFKGVTKLGYNGKIEGGPGRQDALDFIYHGKTAYGATVDEGLQELQVASKSALVNFKDLSSALKDVSDSAGEAGVNAQMARAEMTQLLDTAVKSGYGSAAVGVAELETQTKTSYGRAFQDMDVSDRLRLNHAYMAASLAGMSVSNYLTLGPTAKGAADQILDMATVQAVLKPGVEAWIKEQVAASGGDVTEAVAAQIAEDMIRQFYPNDSPALAQVVGNLTGYSDLAQDPIKAATWIVQQFNGKGVGATASQMTEESHEKREEISKNNAVVTDVGESYRGNVSATGGVSGRWKPLDRERSGGWLFFGGEDSEAVKAYDKWHDKNGGQEDPVVYHLLNKIEGDDESKVVVTTKDGKRVVSLAEAVENHRNELASGQAVIIEGDQAGKTVKEVLGEEGIDPLRDFSAEAKRESSAGQTYETWEKEHTKRVDGEQRLEIGLSAEARRLLTVLDTTGTSGSAATANPPQSPYAANPSYQE